MDIYISGNLPKNNSDGEYVRLQIPALPQEIRFTSAAKIATYHILGTGDVAVPEGSEISEISWEAMLPGKNRKNEPWIRGEWIAPKTIQKYFEKWKSHGTKLKLLITGTPINYYVYISDYEVKYDGGFGDYTYNVTFVKAKDLKVTISKKKNTVKKSQDRQTKNKGKTYTVKSDDTLWAIALKYYGNGAQYTKIYEANKSVIESTAKKHGKSGSNNGWWIWPGCKLTIP